MHLSVFDNFTSNWMEVLMDRQFVEITNEYDGQKIQ